MGIKMAARYFEMLLKPQLSLNFTLKEIQERFIHTSPALFKVNAGKIKYTFKKNKPITYEQSLSPPHIAHRKSWNSWNTSTIEGGRKQSEMTIDDLIIRKFMDGIFPRSILSTVIIKRQYNIIRIAAILKAMYPTTRMAFLIGFTEEMLSHWFQCIVKLEVQVLKDSRAIIFRYV